MTQVDFMIAFGILITIVLFTVFYATNNFESELGIMEKLELRRVSNGLGEQLFNTKGYPPKWYESTPWLIGLEDDMNKIQGVYEEIGDYEHTEDIELSIFYTDLETEPIVYDEFMNEIPSEIKYVGSKILIKFRMHFNPLEKKRANVFYFGNWTGVDYSSNSTDTNVTGRIISGGAIPVLRQDKCSYLKGMDYDEVKFLLGSQHNFKINLIDCDYGLTPPNTNVLVTSSPVLIEKADSLLSSEIARVSVW